MPLSRLRRPAILAASALFVVLTLPAGGAMAAKSCKEVTTQSACEKRNDCTWVKGYTRKDGAKVKPYCRAKGGKAKSTRGDKSSSAKPSQSAKASKKDNSKKDSR